MIHELRSQELSELFAALSKAQSEIRVAVKDSSNPFFKSSYANLQSIIEASRPALCKHGISVLQQIIADGDKDYLVTILGHSSGQWISSQMRINPVKQDVQSLGSYITYLRRYSYAALVGVYDGNEDDDGNDAMPSNTQVYATPDQLKRIAGYTKDNAELLQSIFKGYGIRDLSQLKEVDAVKLLKNLQ